MTRKPVTILAAALIGLAPAVILAQGAQPSTGSTAPNYSEPMTRLQPG